MSKKRVFIFLSAILVIGSGVFFIAEKYTLIDSDAASIEAANAEQEDLSEIQTTNSTLNNPEENGTSEFRQDARGPWKQLSGLIVRKISRVETSLQLEEQYEVQVSVVGETDNDIAGKTIIISTLNCPLETAHNSASVIGRLFIFENVTYNAQHDWYNCTHGKAYNFSGSIQ